MFPTIENYRFKYQSRGKWIFVPSVHGEKRALHILKFFHRDVTFSDFFYHYKSGGHVAALHDHLKNEFFFKIDIKNFFYSISRNRVHRALAARGMKGAPTYAKWSTVRSPYPGGPRYVLPIGFWQSPHLASLVLMQSPVFEAMERARQNGVVISVYLDDIVGSSADKAILQCAYDDIQKACVAANLIPNTEKLVAPSQAIVVFNCDLSKGSAKVTEARITKFFETERSGFSQQAFESYVDRVACANE